MSPASQRLWWLGACYAVALAIVGAHLGGVMLAGHDDWLVRSYRNRWAFRDVPSVRGAVLDRMGRVLTQDEPTFELSCVYERFRLRHPVGAAIHGAVLATRMTGTEVRFTYRGDALGPNAAAAALLGLPVRALLDADLPKDERRELQAAAMTVLVAGSERSWLQVRNELRACAEQAPATPLLHALPDVTAEQLLDAFAAILGRLRALDEALVMLKLDERAASEDDEDDDLDAGAGGDEAAGADPAERPRGLLDRLDRFRVDSLEQRRTRRRLDDGTIREGELLDRLARPVQRALPFALAAAVRVAADDQPGLRLEPALRRAPIDDLPPTLQQILGRVQALDRSPGPDDYLDERVEQALGAELDQLVPDELLPMPEYRQTLLRQAVNSYERVLRTRERRGTGGIEWMLDRELAGAPGMRLVEHDARSKEQLLWSSLRVSPGADVALSVDLDLQRVLEARVAAAAAHWQEFTAAKGGDPGRIDVAMALVDAHSGDVLALAGAPTTVDGMPRLPAVLSWRGNGALGSIVKPLFLLEQLIGERLDLPHADLQQLQSCAGKYRGVDSRTYRCDHAHWDEGTDPVSALAKSCNVFFFQLAEAMGEPGLRRALWRFGLQPAPTGGGDQRFQERPAELPAALAAAPQWVQGRQFVQMRGIGYSLAANPLSVARAYAAIATGSLPTLGLRRGEDRPRYPLGATEAELELVRQGMRECVTRGTADEIDGLLQLGVLGKTGTAEIAQGANEANNAWFAGCLPGTTAAGVQLVFAAVVYAVPDRTHGADAAGQLVADVLQDAAHEPALAQRYVLPAAAAPPVQAPREGDGR
ncbi:MAG: penicillin-binding transpeptidase domain-containing protein [Planctomycetota bacterium]